MDFMFVELYVMVMGFLNLRLLLKKFVVEGYCLKLYVFNVEIEEKGEFNMCMM